MSRFAWLKAFALFALATLVALVPGPRAAHAGNDGVAPDHDRGNIARSSARIDEQIGGQVPLDLVLRDEDDKEITLGAAMAGKPTILVPVYYRCPMLCTKILNGVLEACRQMPKSYSAGQQFTIVAVSMDPKEHTSLAKPKKKAYLEGDPSTGQAGLGCPEAGWRFLTGDINEKVAHQRLATLFNAIGFRFEFDKMVKEFDHPAGIVILSPQGKITRYFYGITYDGEFELDVPTEQKNGKVTRPSTTLQLSLIEAADGKGGSLWTKLKMVCYRYDHLNQGYALNVLTFVRIGGVITLAALIAAVVLFLRYDRRKTRASVASAPAALTPAQPNGATPTPTGGTA